MHFENCANNIPNLQINRISEKYNNIKYKDQQHET